MTESKIKRERAIVECDDKCGAFEDPETMDEYRDTLEHYKYCKYLGGCAHGS